MDSGSAESALLYMPMTLTDAGFGIDGVDLPVLFRGVVGAAAFAAAFQAL